MVDKVTVIGLGYVGFPLACAIAKSNLYDVYGLEVDKSKVDKVNNKISTIEDEQAIKDIQTVKVTATSDETTLKDSKFIVICVPTPINHDKKPDLTPVIKAAESISRNLTKGQIIILESTVNPGVCEENVLPVLEKSGLIGGVDFELVHCPERINPGDPKWNVYNIPRNIGGLTQFGTQVAANFYRSFLNAPVNEMSSLKAAEATKIVENTFRDVNIAYVNELAQCFDSIGIDVYEVIKGASNKPFAFMPHFPGCGVGGHCIPVDPYYLIDYADHHGFDHALLKAARTVNNSMPHYTVHKLEERLNALNLPLKGSKVGLLGLAYKADMSDIRESPALEIKKDLESLGATVLTCDPYCDSANSKLSEILETCAGVIIATSHHQFIEITDWKNVKVIIDGRNCLDMVSIKEKGIIYNGIGRGN